MSPRSIARSRRRRGITGGSLAAGALLIAAPAAGAEVFEVDTGGDGASAGTCTAAPGDCNLRDAVVQANGTVGADEITFNSAITGEIVLAGELSIQDATTITGPGSGALAISGDSNDDGPDATDERIFNIDPTFAGTAGDPVSISGLTLTEGYSADEGGGIFSTSASLALSDVTLSANNSSDEGAGLYLEGGSLEVADSVFEDNETSGFGGGIFLRDTVAASDTHVRVTDTSFIDNRAGDGAGIYAGNNAGGFVLDTVVMQGGVASDDGGGLVVGQYYHAAADAPVTIIDSTFSGNTAADAAGAIWLLGTGPSGVTIERTTIHDNEAGYGGGISQYGRYEGEAEIIDSTITENTATAEYLGGGVFLFGADDPDYDGIDAVSFENTIVADNLAPMANAGGDGVDLADPTGSPALFEASFSLIGDGGDGVTTFTDGGNNIFEQSPDLGPLANNGGSTRTRLPNETSPVIDAGNATGVDQRGLARPVDLPAIADGAGNAADIGAVEREADPPDPDPDTSVLDPDATAKKKQKIGGKKVKVKIKGGAGEQVTGVAKGRIKVKKGNKGKRVVTGAEAFKLKKVTKTTEAGEQTVYRLKLKKKDNKKVLKLLGKGRDLRANPSIKFTDQAGNVATERRVVRLKAKKSKKK